MTTKLPEVVTRYYEAANGFRAEEMVECFTTDALVHDEEHEHVGHEAIRAWIAETTKKYQPRYEIVGSTVSADPDDAGGEAVNVMASVSGTFPGSPIVLDFEFTIRAGKIARLGIG